MDSIFDQLNSHKVIILFESAPLTDEFEQIMLTQEQFKKFSEFFFTIYKKGPDGAIDIVTDADQKTKLKDIKIWYEDKETEPNPFIRLL
jgi:hypothetical protein